MIFSMENAITTILNMTAWRMDAPQLFGVFHICALVLTAAFALAAAVLFARHVDSSRSICSTLKVTGWVLVVLEVYKQLFLYFVVNGKAFDFWFFPFQLCSIPMYLCILLPLVGPNIRRTFMTFMGGYTFVSAVAALVFPEDILRPFVTLTLHGFVWHGLLLFISMFIFLTGSTESDAHGLRRAAGLYVILSIVAVMMNIAFESVMPAIRSANPGITHDWAAMFYLNPFHISPQPVVSTVQEAAGIPLGLLLYTLVIAVISSLIIMLFKSVFKKPYPVDAGNDL
jgi:hypothetical protein